METHLTPAAGTSTILMFHQQVTCANLPAIAGMSVGSTVGGDLRSAVVLSHVSLELLGVGSWRWLPSRLLL